MKPYSERDGNFLKALRITDPDDDFDGEVQRATVSEVFAMSSSLLAHETQRADAEELRANNESARADKWRSTAFVWLTLCIITACCCGVLGILLVIR